MIIKSENILSFNAPGTALISKRKRTTLTMAKVLGPNYYDHWDAGNAATMSVDVGGEVNYIDSLGLNGARLESSGINRPMRITSPILGNSVIDFEGLSEYMEVLGSTGMYNFLHDGSGGTVIIVARVDDANPDNLQVLIGNSVNTSGIGFLTTFDDRSSLSRFDSIRNFVFNGSSGNPPIFNDTGGNAFDTQQYNSLVNIIDAANVVAADRNFITINGVDYANNSENNSPTLANASGNLTVGQGITGAFNFKGQIAEIIIANAVLSPLKISQVQTILKDKYGNFPIS